MTELISKPMYKKMHRACVYAKQFLSDGKVPNCQTGKTNYICFALERVSQNRWLGRSARLVKQVIQERLDGTESVDKWLKREGFVPEYANYMLFLPEIQEYRHQWLDALAEEFLAKSL